MDRKIYYLFIVQGGPNSAARQVVPLNTDEWGAMRIASVLSHHTHAHVSVWRKDPELSNGTEALVATFTG